MLPASSFTSAATAVACPKSYDTAARAQRLLRRRLLKGRARRGGSVGGIEIENIGQRPRDRAGGGERARAGRAPAVFVGKMRWGSGGGRARRGRGREGRSLRKQRTQKRHRARTGMAGCVCLTGLGLAAAATWPFVRRGEAKRRRRIRICTHISSVGVCDVQRGGQWSRQRREGQGRKGKGGFGVSVRSNRMMSTAAARKRGAKGGGGGG